MIRNHSFLNKVGIVGGGGESRGERHAHRFVDTNQAHRFFAPSSANTYLDSVLVKWFYDRHSQRVILIGFTNKISTDVYLWFELKDGAPRTAL